MRVGMFGVPILWWLGLTSCYGRERSSHPHQTALHPHSPPTSPSSPPLHLHNARRCYSSGFIFTHDEDHKAWSPFFKGTFFVFPALLPSPSLTHPGHPRPIRNSRCFSATHNTQAIFSVLLKFLLHVRLLIPLPPPYSLFIFPR